MKELLKKSLESRKVTDELIENHINSGLPGGNLGKLPNIVIGTMFRLQSVYNGLIIPHIMESNPLATIYSGGYYKPSLDEDGKWINMFRTKCYKDIYDLTLSDRFISQEMYVWNYSNKKVKLRVTSYNPKSTHPFITSKGNFMNADPLVFKFDMYDRSYSA